MAGLVVGPPVRGEDLFNREDEIKLIWESLKNGSVFLAAPRRFGKTSTMLNLRDQPRKNWRVFVLDTEWIRGAPDFIAELASELLRWKKFREILKNASKKLKNLFGEIAVKIPLGGGVPEAEVKIAFRDKISEEWIENGKQFLRMLSAADENILFILDEFPVMIKRMARRGEEETVNFLYWLRALRQGSHRIQNVRFIVGGSIGIERILARLKVSDTINDLAKVEILPFSEPVARQFVNEIFASENLGADDSIADKILELSGPAIPYFIQVLIFQVKKEAQFQKAEIDEKFVEEVYRKKVLGVECRTYFQYYCTRLGEYYDPEEEKAAKALLIHLAKAGEAAPRALYGVYLQQTGRTGDRDGFSYLMTELENDFYIRFDAEEQVYSFGSKILRDWWLRHYGLIE